jgi:beta-xylosidase
MKSLPARSVLLLLALVLTQLSTNAQNARNPVMFADVPDMAMIRVGYTYYMSSTTMHLSPVLPIMISKDMVN